MLKSGAPKVSAEVERGKSYRKWIQKRKE